METLIQERLHLLDEVLKIASQYLDIDKGLILKCRAEEYTEARYIVISILSRYYTDKEISHMTGITRTGVNNIRNRFQHKIQKKSIQQIFNRIDDLTKSLFLQ